jgi:predicted alpha/beta-fold hydrolase
MLKASALKKISESVINHIKPAQLKEIKTLFDFDDKVTAPLNGFLSAEHYYQQASGQQVMADIEQPCLFVHSADDPFLNHQCSLPKQKLPKHLVFEVSQYGGHVGFIYGHNPLRPRYWLEERVPDFLANHLMEKK